MWFAGGIAWMLFRPLLKPLLFIGVVLCAWNSLTAV